MKEVFLVHKPNGDIDCGFMSLAKAKHYLQAKHGGEFLGQWEVVITDRNGPSRWVRTLYSDTATANEGDDIGIDRVTVVTGD